MKLVGLIALLRVLDRFPEAHDTIARIEHARTTGKPISAKDTMATHMLRQLACASTDVDLAMEIDELLSEVA